jgi:hypothetical protein
MVSVGVQRRSGALNGPRRVLLLITSGPVPPKRHVASPTGQKKVCWPKDAPGACYYLNRRKPRMKHEAEKSEREKVVLIGPAGPCSLLVGH